MRYCIGRKDAQNIDTGSLLEHFPGAKKTLKGRLVYLERKGLIERFPKFNAGGYGNPNYYVAKLR